MSLTAGAIDILPSDRLAMADRLFNRGEYAAAATEYRALAGEKTIAADQLLYRQAECERALGRAEEANRLYGQLALKFPDSEFAAQSRLMVAISQKGAERKQSLQTLDSDRVPAKIRAEALYHYGAENGDVAALERSVKLDPKGNYAPYAQLRRGVIMSESKDAAVRRAGVGVLLDLAFGKGPLADEAMYLSATISYREGKYGEAGSLFRRYYKRFPQGRQAAAAQTMSIWCDFMEGRYSDVLAACGEAKTDDLAYLKAAATCRLSGETAAQPLFRAYLEQYPRGRYRQEVELELSRIEFTELAKGKDLAKAIESAKLVMSKGGQASDALRLAWILEKAGRLDEADSEYAKIVKQYAQSVFAVQAVYARAMLAARRDDWAKAEILLAESIASKQLEREKLALATYWRGVAALKLGHEQEGCDLLNVALQKGLGLDEAREARLLLADADYRAGRLDAARNAYLKLVREGAVVRMSASRLYAVGRLLSGEEAAVCAQALIKSDSAEWRQCGWVRLGEIEAAKESYTAAIDFYRKALAEKVRTTDAARAALALGKLETRAGEYSKAENSLKEAVKLNAKDAKVRAQVYVALAENAKAAGDAKSARGYATVVNTLFEDPDSKAAADKILKSLQTEKEESQ